MAWRGYLKINKDGSGGGWIEGLPEKKVSFKYSFPKNCFFYIIKIYHSQKTGVAETPYFC